MPHPFIDLIDPKDFDYVSTELRSFFKSRNLIEVPTQHRQSILAACEQPDTIATYDFGGSVWPLPQTGQMWLEYEILTRPNEAGYFCYTTSYRQEPNPIPGRHNLCFPMMECEIHGGMDALLDFERDMLEYLGYGQRDTFKEMDYLDIVKLYNVEDGDLTHTHETRLYKDFGPVCMIKNFPQYTSPFWNMKMNMENKTANKIDVILSGIETIGSAERSCNKEEMRKMFNEISGGAYANTLFSRFGRKRVIEELDEFLSHNFIPRSGFGLGVTRLIRSLKMERIHIE